jgi:peroxin-4
MSPPKMRFITPIFHPNVHFQTGEICMDVLKSQWQPEWSFNSLAIAIKLIMAEPNAESPLNPDAGNMIRAGDLLAYDSMAKAMAEIYAIDLTDFKEFSYTH